MTLEEIAKEIEETMRGTTWSVKGLEEGTFLEVLEMGDANAVVDAGYELTPEQASRVVELLKKAFEADLAEWRAMK